MPGAPREAYGDLATTAFVEASILFKSLDPDARHDLLRLGQVLTFAEGEVVSGEEDEGFYIVREGSAAVVAETPGGRVELYRLERGAFFGVARALGTRRAGQSLQALSEATVVAFPAPVVGALAERFPKVKKLLEAVQTAREKEAASRLER
jgi:CRP-like cAMP-binding protein